LETPEGNIPITSSLNDALKRLRSMNETPHMQFNHDPLIIWVDAVCINQEDNREKSQQIRLMSQIYKLALYVAVYLGNEADDSQLAIQLLGKLALANIGLGGLEAAVLPPTLAKEWESVASLLDRPWFRRVWIIQEFIVGAQVAMICGEIITGWEDSDYRGTEGLRKQSRLNALNAIIRIGRERIQSSVLEHGEKSPLLTLLKLFSVTEATQPRDHLFALLGLASDTEDKSFDPDYEAPLGEIIRRYAATFVQKGRAIEMLLDAGISPAAPQLPSWVPDWTRSAPQPFLIPDPIGMKNQSSNLNAIYHASANLPPKIQYDTATDLLVIEGGIVDRVGQIGQRDDEMDILGRLSLYISDAENIIGTLSSYPTGEDVSEVEWRTLIANRTKTLRDLQGIGSNAWDGDLSEPTAQLGEAYKALKLFCWVVENNPGYIFSSDERIAFLQTTKKPYEQPLLDTRSGRLLCRTEGGYVGLVPRHTQAGDLVCIVYGSPVPFIVRESDEREGAHRVVGECYIHGIMRGEALQSKQFEERKIYMH
ncbi:hypothetical protein OIDMADRAFT_128054, partial [Oidiodendron maius Zn]